MSARSFFVSGADNLAAALRGLRADVPRATGALVFATKAPTDAIAREIAAALPGTSALVVPAAGVLNERNEAEGEAAVSGLLWSGGTATLLTVPTDDTSPSAVGAAIAEASGGERCTVLLFTSPELPTDHLSSVAEHAPKAFVFGGGAVAQGPQITSALLSVSSTGRAREGRAVGLVLRGLARPIVEVASACKLLTRLLPIEEMDGGLVLRVGESAALDLLSSCLPELRARGTETRPALVMAALADQDPDHPIILPVRGVDPERRGVMIGAMAKRGMLLGFAARDAAAARSMLEAKARALSQAAMGAAPRFALHITCAGRGRALYGSSDVESRILRQRFGDLPIVGLRSAYELSPQDPGVRVETYTSVTALFRSPS
jgi:small ligand-binding sensory domain FIST